ncbi:probable G-protein coupled receptor 139 isoform X1 [Stegostoma tigrinum]|uniref:probable G-protein coupled receptor 139 isoform X1 n=1 Tax=Stegostoma tigrinum TaxID=3053191 RepID=UPI00202AFDED|nr:probable G-protein coupled receptor 139 isoform X1 [Stegostoma tigrinum]
MGQPVIIQVENICYPILAIVGVPANLVTIIILSREICDLSKCVTRYFVAMAVADLSVLVFDVIFYEIKDYYFPNLFFNYTPICTLSIVLNMVSVDCSVWLTVAFTFDRFVAISCQKLQIKYCSAKTATRVIGIVCSVSILQTVPTYFAFEPREIIDNRPWSCSVKASFYKLPLWIAYWWMEIILTPFLPFVLILFFNVLTIRSIVQTNRIRRRLRGNDKDLRHNDPQMVNRRKSMIILMAISGNFIILWIVTLVTYLLVQFTDAKLLVANYNDPFTILEQTGYMLRTLSCCTNTFIYAVSQRKFKDELKKLIMHPASLLIHFCKYVVNSVN